MSALEAVETQVAARRSGRGSRCSGCSMRTRSRRRRGWRSGGSPHIEACFLYGVVAGLIAFFLS